MFEEGLKVSCSCANQIQFQGTTWRDWLPNIINCLAALGSLAAAYAAWQTVVQMRQERNEEKELAAPILQFIKAHLTIPDLSKLFEPVWLIISFANARKNTLLTANHIAFIINGEKKVYTYYKRELPCGGNTSDELIFNARLMEESKFKDKPWSIIFFIEVTTPHGLSRTEVCFIRIPGPDNDNMPSSEISPLIQHPHLCANYYRLEYIPKEERIIINNYLKTFNDPKWAKFCNKFKDYFTASWE